MSVNSTKAITAVAVVLISAFCLYAWFVGFGPSFQLAEHKAIGEAAAEEAIKLAGPNGRVTLFARDTETYENPATDAQVAGFKRAMKRSGGNLASIRLVKQDPLRLITLPVADFLETLRKQPDTAVIVSLLGPPVLDEARIAALGEKRPKVVALCSGWMPRQVDLRQLLQQGLLTVAIVSREGALPAIKSSSPRDRFNSLFNIVTAANTSDLPLVARSNP